MNNRQALMTVLTAQDVGRLMVDLWPLVCARCGVKFADHQRQDHLFIEWQDLAANADEGPQ